MLYFGNEVPILCNQTLPKSDAPFREAADNVVG